MPLLTFSQLREGIDQRITDPAITMGAHFCFYKLFQHALTYSLTETNEKLLPNRLHWPVFAQKLIFSLKSLRNSAEPKAMKRVLLMDDGRIGADEHGSMKSYYFGTILDEIGRENATIARDHKHDSALPREYEIGDLLPFANKALDPDEIRMLKDIQLVLGKAKKTGDFTPHEFNHIASSLHSFFEQYHMFYQWLKKGEVQVLLMTNHYHREGLIAAAKDLSIKSFEFQHGLISGQDLYYVYGKKLAPFEQQAFFCDHLVVFGTYWKDILLKGAGYTEDQIMIAGDYSIQSKGWLAHKGAVKQNAIFIGAQKNMPEYYIKYTKNLLAILAKKHPDWEVWVKLHPYEKEPELYNTLLTSSNCKLYGNGDDLMSLLSQCKIQISVYSTTFFDALGLGVLNLSIQNYTSGSDYAASMISEGVALPIDFDSDPVSLFHESSPRDLLQREDVYAEINLSNLKQLIGLA